MQPPSSFGLFRSDGGKRRLAVVAPINRGTIRNLRYCLLRGAAQCGIGLAAVMPRRVGLALFGAAGVAVYAIPHPDRERTRKHLKLIYGSTWNGRRIRTTARDVYHHLGKNIFDAFCLPRLAPEEFNRIVTHDPLDDVAAAYAKGRGAIIITAHTGCFEMLLHFFPMHGFRSFAVGRKLHDEGLDRIIRGTRSGEDIVYMDRSEPIRKIIRHLQEGRLFGVLVDQDTAVEGVFADFLGRSAFTPSGPVKIAMKTDIPVFVATTARQKGEKHHVFIKGPLELRRNGDFGEDLVYNVAMVNRIIGETIGRYPEQWVWMHRRWRRQPSGGSGSSGAEVL